MQRLLRLVLGALGVFIGWSAFQHWTYNADMRGHYALTPLGMQGQYIIAGAQTFAATLLLSPRYQVAAGLTFGTVVLAITSRHLRAESIESSFWPPLLVSVWAIVPAALLLWVQRRVNPESIH